MRLRIYIDTSVIGGCLDEEFREGSVLLFDEFKHGRSVAVVSDLTLLELELAPESVRAILDEVPREHVEFVELTDESANLAAAYIDEGVVSDANLVDAQHIAIATVSRVNVLVSWNFKHIVNLRRIQAYNSVNLRRGYPLLEIRTPREVLTDDNEAE